MWIGSRLALRPASAWTLGIATGFFLGFFVQNLRIGSSTAFEKLLHPRVAIDWLPWLAVIAAAIQLLAAYAPRNWHRWLLVLACVFAVAVPLRLLAGSVYVTQRWGTAEKLGVLLAWSLVFAALWTTFSIGRRNRSPLLRGILLVLVAIGTAITLAASGALTLGEFAGVAAATLFGATAVAWATGSFANGPGEAAGPIAIMLGGLIFIGYYYSQLSLSGVVLLTISLSAAAGYLPLPWGEARGEGASHLSWTAILIRTSLALVPLIVAAAAAISTALANPYG
jgi:hypothetical protein